MSRLFCLPGTSTLIVITALAVIMSASAPDAQTVSTFLTGSGLNGPDGFALDSAENLYVANWGGGYGTTVLKITSDGVVTTFDSTSNAPDGLAFDNSGNLYISNYASGVIHKVTPAGVKTEFASGFQNPSALAFDTDWNLYVSNFGSTTVSKITPDSTVSEFASGFNGPLGLVFDPAGNLYVANYNSGVINKVGPDSTVSVFATVPNPVGSRIQYLVRGHSGNLYLPSYTHNKVYRISTSGEVTVLAGTGAPGGNDGPAEEATFNGPNSITLTSAGDLYVSEYNANRIRIITGAESAASIDEQRGEAPGKILLWQNCPNPFAPDTRIRYTLADITDITLKVYDASGRKIRTLVERDLSGGYHETHWDGKDDQDQSVSPGIYYCRLSSGSATDSKKMILLN